MVVAAVPAVAQADFDDIESLDDGSFVISDGFVVFFGDEDDLFDDDFVAGPLSPAFE